MEKIILVRYGEIILKGLNRPVFEDKLVKLIKESLQGLGKVSVQKAQGRIFVEPQTENYDFQSAISKLVKVFGIVSVSIVWKINSDYEEIKKHALLMVQQIIENRNDNQKTLSFKVNAKRGDKRFPMQSPEICCEIGAEILERFPMLTVDVNNPDFILYIEVREFSYIYSEIIPAHGGMPIGTNGKALLLLSGGIDSPVAGWMIAKRGVSIDAIHFYSYPYTSERAKDKVIELTKILAAYCVNINLHIVPFTEIQLEINEKCPNDNMTIIMRRFMMKISEKIANSVGALALITGESVGQVASQTIHGLFATNDVVRMPVFRPLIGMDKNEVIEIARKIDTFETSILPYEDCCTVFVAKHPNTKPKVEKIMQYESHLDSEAMIQRAIENTTVISISNRKES